MFSLHLIGYPDFFDGEVDVIVRLLHEYEVYFHLRKPKATTEEYERFVECIPSSLYSRIFLHSAYQLAEYYEFAGLHFSTSKRELASHYSNALLKSTSCHSIAEVRTLNSDFRQCFLSPIFSSISKPGYKQGFDKETLEIFLKEQDAIECIALGGVCAENINELNAMGFGGAAVLGAIWGNEPAKGDDFSARLEAMINEIIS